MSYTSLKTEMIYSVQRAEDVISNPAKAQPIPISSTDLGDYNHQLLADTVRLEDAIKQSERVQDKITAFIQVCDNPDQLAKLDTLATGSTTQKLKGYLQTLHEARSLLVDTQITQKQVLSKISATTAAPTTASTPAPTTTVFQHDQYLISKMKYDRFEGGFEKKKVQQRLYVLYLIVLLNNTIMIIPLMIYCMLVHPICQI
uniref:Uncharacterized protein n=1 Tax=Panagrolaimus superbus TaxID=310955 RepID=A0A914ZCT7_9BILA